MPAAREPINLAAQSQEWLDELANTKGYEHLFEEGEPEEHLEGKTYDEWTVPTLREYADIEGIELTETRKQGIWNEILEYLKSD